MSSQQHNKHNIQEGTLFADAAYLEECVPTEKDTLSWSSTVKLCKAPGPTGVADVDY
jgi:hypothetical protein